MSAARRVTISDVAREAGVSIGAVSHAVNGRKGVSEATRARVVEVAARLGWRPDPAARSLTRSRTGAVAVVLGTELTALGSSGYFTAMVAGIESVLAERDHTLQLQADPAMEADLVTHRRWLQTRQVDGLILVDHRANDPRVAAMRGLPELPAVAIGDPIVPHGLAVVDIAEGAAMRETVQHLAALGHRRIALIDRPPDRAARSDRDAAFRATSRVLGVHGEIVVADPADGGPAGATRRLLAQDLRPTALIFDGETTAIAGLAAAAEAGVPVPRELSVVGWYDSALLESVYPPLSAVGFDARAVGEDAARLLLDLLDGAEPRESPLHIPHLTVRGSTAPPT